MNWFPVTYLLANLITNSIQAWLTKDYRLAGMIKQDPQIEDYAPFNICKPCTNILLASLVHVNIYQCKDTMGYTSIHLNR